MTKVKKSQLKKYPIMVKYMIFSNKLVWTTTILQIYTAVIATHDINLVKKM